MKTIAQIISVLAIIIAVVWFYYERDFEPVITALFGIAGLIASFRIKGKQKVRDATPQERDEKGRSAITLEDFYERLSDPSKTLLQKREFMDKYMGCIVQWEGVVTSVAPVGGGSVDELTLFFQSRKHASEENKEVVAFFPASEKKDLLELSTGDFVKIEGEVSFYGRGETPSLRDAKLLSFSKDELAESVQDRSKLDAALAHLALLRTQGVELRNSGMSLRSEDEIDKWIEEKSEWRDQVIQTIESISPAQAEVFNTLDWVQQRQFSPDIPPKLAHHLNMLSDQIDNLKELITKLEPRFKAKE